MSQRATLLLRTVGTIGAAALLAAGLTACGDDDDGLPPPPASPPPADPADDEEALDLTPEEQEAVDEAQLVIDDFFEAYVEDARLGEPYETEIGPVIGGRPLEFAAAQLSQELQAVSVQHYRDGVIFEGDFSWDYVGPEGADLDLVINDLSVPEVYLNYCLDATTWTPVDRETNESVGEPGDRRIAIISAVWYDDGDGSRTEGWRVSGWQDEASGSC